MTRLIIILILLLAVSLAFAHMEEMKIPEEVVDEIMSSQGQGITNINQIDCSKVSDDQLEELGDTVMERMIGDHELHEVMDERMGGEGSESLKQAHVGMGARWLGCVSRNYGWGMMPMMMSPNMMGNMMNYYPQPPYYRQQGIDLSLIGWILFLAAAAYIAYMILGKKKRKHH